MNKEQLLSVIRLTLTTLGVSLVASGTIDEVTYTNLSGALITLVSGIWSIVDKSDASMAKKLLEYQAKVEELQNNIK
jgi:hypothetical protein